MREKPKLGDYVWFGVENQDMWGGDRYGILVKEFCPEHKKKEIMIKTEHNGLITINHGLDAYSGTIKKAYF